MNTYYYYPYFCLPIQQSAALLQLLPEDEKSAKQLFVPHVRLPAQSESVSQSPPPTLHGLAVVQQLQSVEGTPSHCPAGGGAAVGGPKFRNQYKSL